MNLLDTQKQLAQQAARLIYEEGLDYFTAKQKAIVGFTDNEAPTNLEIHQALIAYSRDIAGDANTQRLKHLQQIALEALQFLQDYEPLMTGHLLDQIASPHTTITLHLFASAHEEVFFFLDQQQIPYDLDEHHLQIGKQLIDYPSIHFMVDDAPVELVIFPNERGHRIPPISPATDKAMQRLNHHKFRKRIERQ